MPPTVIQTAAFDSPLQRFRPYSPARSQEDNELVLGISDAMRYVMFRVEQVAATDATVLLYGETGTGKELLARAIHRQSPRARPPSWWSTARRCPRRCIESELFGRERGAFTGAHSARSDGSSCASRDDLPRRNRRAAARTAA